MEADAAEHERLAAASHGPVALQHAIKAADLYLGAMKKATATTHKTRLKSAFNRIVTIAERLKRDQDILNESSHLHGVTFPPWNSDPEDAGFSEHYTDETVFPLSEQQLTVFDGWKRPRELFPGENESNFMRMKQDCDLVQDLTTDCSVVASLCASMPHLVSGHMSLSDIMFPFDKNDMQPRVSPSGKYIFRMHFNGCFRQVTIDDRLPASRNSRSLFTMDRSNPQILWPALIEKAYLKVRGGYDFLGSNSGTDLWVLTGWIPEQVFLQNDDIDLDDVWRLIKSHHDQGDVVVTLGTGRLSQNEEKLSGLAGEHDYAVLRVVISSGTRKFLIKNPWRDGSVWKRVGSTSVLEDDNGNPGSFWMTFEDVVQNFESVYLNWNPRMLPERQDRHLQWTLQGEYASIASNPQFSVRAHKSATVWVLVSRHFSDDELIIVRSQSTSSLAEKSNKLGFMSLYIFGNNGKRVDIDDGAIYRGPFVDSHQTLAKLEAVGGVPYTVALLQHGLPLPKYSFTVSVLSTTPVEVVDAVPRMAHYSNLSGSWTRRTSGGNQSTPTYFQNPQYRIEVSKKTPLTILLDTNNPDTRVHIDLLWSQGQRAMSMEARDIAATSGEYRRGCAVIDIPSLQTGIYTAICSTFESGQLCDFRLQIGSMVKCKTTLFSSDTAGLMSMTLPPAVFGETERKKRAHIQSQRLTKVTAIATCPYTSNCTIRLALEYGQGPNMTYLAVSGDGDFKYPSMGIRLSNVDIDPDKARVPGIWIAVEVMGGPSHVDVQILSESRLIVGQWETVDS